MIRELIVFTVGAGAGFAGAYLLLKNKYETMANEEIESMREYVKNKLGDSDTEPKDNEKGSSKKDVEKFDSVTVNYNTISSNLKEERKMKPYRISEADFVIEDEDFDKVSLEYYQDTELLFEGNEAVVPEETIGIDIFNMIHGIVDEVFYVRNEDLGIDYEVISVPGSGPEGGTNV